MNHEVHKLASLSSSVVEFDNPYLYTKVGSIDISAHTISLSQASPFFPVLLRLFPEFLFLLQQFGFAGVASNDSGGVPPREKNVAPANIFDPMIAVLLVDRVGSSTAVKIAEPPLEPTILPREDGAEWSGDTFRTAFRDVHHYKFRLVFP